MGINGFFHPQESHPKTQEMGTRTSRVPLIVPSRNMVLWSGFVDYLFPLGRPYQTFFSEGGTLGGGSRFMPRRVGFVVLRGLPLSCSTQEYYTHQNSYRYPKWWALRDVMAFKGCTAYMFLIRIVIFSHKLWHLPFLASIFWGGNSHPERHVSGKTAVRRTGSQQPIIEQKTLVV